MFEGIACLLLLFAGGYGMRFFLSYWAVGKKQKGRMGDRAGSTEK